jgi:hypothetical protein
MTSASSSSSSTDAEQVERVDLGSVESFFDTTLKFDDINVSVEEQLKLDADVQVGLNVFLENKIKESRAIFARQSRKNPMYLFGAATIDAIGAILSLEKQSIENANKMLSAVEQFTSALLPQENPVVSFGKWIIGGRKPMTNAELRLRVIRAEVSFRFAEIV